MDNANEEIIINYIKFMYSILYKLSCSIYAIWIGYIFCVVQVNKIKR